MNKKRITEEPRMGNDMKIHEEILENEKKKQRIGGKKEGIG